MIGTGGNGRDGRKRIAYCSQLAVGLMDTLGRCGRGCGCGGEGDGQTGEDERIGN